MDNCLKLKFREVKFPDQLKLLYLFLQVKLGIVRLDKNPNVTLFDHTNTNLSLWQDKTRQDIHLPIMGIGPNLG